MSFDYKVLIFKPYSINDQKYEDILWKAQIDSKNYIKSIYLELLKDNIEYNNRRRLKDWTSLLKQNCIEYETKYSAEYAKSLTIKDKDNLFDLQLFACDIKATNYLIEVSYQYILGVLYILELNKSGLIFPNYLKRKINEAKDIIINNDDKYNKDSEVYLSIFKQIEKIIEVCQNYECDIEYKIVDR